MIPAAVTAWVAVPAQGGTPPPHDASPRQETAWLLAGNDAKARRLDALRRAAVRLPVRDVPRAPEDIGTTGIPLTCQFLAQPPDGTSAKFDCTLPDGMRIKVKYGRNPEIHAETAASRLLTALGYPVDAVTIVPTLRCHGCPRFPFFTMQLLALTGAGNLLAPSGHERGYTDFDWVAVERRFPAPAIETPTEKGWAWFELQESLVERADLDALRLLAVFLAHWDNKVENQRLVCLDQGPAPPDGVCRQPLAMIQDLGATFGPTKMNLATWRSLPIWADRKACTVSMAGLPFRGGTFPDARISETGRTDLARRLAALSDEQIRAIVTDARIPQFYAATSDRRDLEAWTAAFRFRVDQIARREPCTN